MSWVARHGDTLPTFVATLKQSGAAINLTTVSSVVFDFVEGETPSIACTVVSAAAGTVSMLPTGLAIGEYKGVFRLTYANGGRLTVPTTGYVSLTVVE